MGVLFYSQLLTDAICVEFFVRGDVADSVVTTHSTREHVQRLNSRFGGKGAVRMARRKLNHLGCSPVDSHRAMVNAIVQAIIHATRSRQTQGYSNTTQQDSLLGNCVNVKDENG